MDEGLVFDVKRVEGRVRRRRGLKSDLEDEKNVRGSLV